MEKPGQVAYEAHSALLLLLRTASVPASRMFRNSKCDQGDIYVGCLLSMVEKVVLSWRKDVIEASAVHLLTKSNVDITYEPILPRMWIGNHSTQFEHDNQSDGQLKAARRNIQS